MTLAMLAVLLDLQAAAKLTTDLYDHDPNHPFNRVHAALFLRRAQDATVYGEDEVDPLLWPASDYLFAPERLALAIAALDELLAHDARDDTLLGRVLLQRDLWALFDWLCDARDPWHEASVVLQTKLARAIRALGIDASEAAMLPDGECLIASVRENMGELTDDLFAARGPWVLLAAEGTTEPIATVHDHHTQSRSVFGVLMRVAPQRSATLDYLATLRAFRAPLIWDGPASVEPPLLSTQLPSFPEGTSLALVRRLVHVCRDGRLMATPLVETVQLIRHRVVALPGTDTDRVMRRFIEFSQREDAREVFELRLSRRDLLTGKGGLRRVTESNRQFRLLGSHGGDPLAAGGGDRRVETLKTCSDCHGHPGIYSVNTFTRVMTGPGTIPMITVRALPAQLIDTTWVDVERSTIARKKARYDWGLLEGLVGR